MKICLINPPKTMQEHSDTSSIGGKPSIGLPLGLLYVAGALEQAGHTVSVIDCLVGKEVITKKLENDILYYGYPYEVIKQKIRQINPDIVGIGSQFSAQAKNSEKMAKLVKEIDTNILVIAGGPHMTIKGYDTMKSNPCFDVIVCGEGEYTAVELLDAIENKQKLNRIKGIIFRNKSGQIIQNPPREYIVNLDALPLPAYHLVDMEQYLSLYQKGIYGRNPDEKRAISIITSRGCPFNCIFCSIHLHMGKLFRAHSPEYVLKHIAYLAKTYNVKHIHFEDDNFTFNLDRCEKIIDGMINNKFNLVWDTPNGVRADRLNSRLLRKMKKSGLLYLTIGIESGDQKVLDNIISKTLKLEDVETVTKLCYKEHISLGAFFVVGFPGETIKEMNNTKKFACRLIRKYGLRNPGGAMIATPLYGTRLYDICKKNNYFIDEVTPELLAEATQRMGRGLIQTPDFTPKDIIEFNKQFIRDCYANLLLFYLKHPLRLKEYAFKLIKRKLRNMLIQKQSEISLSS